MLENLSSSDASHNVLLAPLTVASQLASALHDEQLEGPKISLPATDTLIDVQGFCVGFLTAAIIASSRDIEDLKVLAAKALALAVCIGAAVDSDEAAFQNSCDGFSSCIVQWKKESHNAIIKDALAATPLVSCIASMSRKPPSLYRPTLTTGQKHL